MQIIAKGHADRQLQKMVKGIESVASSQFRYLVSIKLAKETAKLVEQNFRQQKGPEKNPWAPLKHRKGRILSKTRKGRKSYQLKQISSRGFVYGPTRFYMHIHQRGAPKINLPARPQVPSSSELPVSWARRYKRVVNRMMRERLKQ